MSTVRKFTLQPAFTFDQLYQDFYNQRVSSQMTAGTLGIYSYTVKPFCDWADQHGFQPSTAERKHVRAYIAELTLSGRAKATVSLHGRNIHALLRFGQLEGICPHVDFTGLLPRPPRRKQPVAQKDDIELLLEQHPSPRDRAMVLLMFESGVRRKETCNLNWGDIDFDLDDLIRIKVRSGKNDKDRITFAGARTRFALEHYRPTVPNSEEDPLFASTRGGRLGIQGIDRVYKKLCRTAGLHITSHAVRRGFAVEHRKIGVWDFSKAHGSCVY